MSSEPLAALLRAWLGIAPTGKHDPTTGFSFSGVCVITDYFILLEGFALAAYTFFSLTTTAEVRLYMIFSGLGFGVAGVVHHRVGAAVDLETGKSSLLLAGCPRNFPMDLLRPEAAYVRDWGLAVSFNCLGTLLELVLALQYSSWGPDCAVAAFLGHWILLAVVWIAMFVYVASDTTNVVLVFLFCMFMYVVSIAVSILSGRTWLAIHGVLACVGFLFGAFGPKWKTDYDKDFVYHMLTFVGLAVLLKGLQ